LGDGRKTRAEMVGEALREAGILVAVFGIMDAFLDHEIKDHKFTWIAAVSIVSAALFRWGVKIEEGREP
jgi:hypothetical protein